METLTENIDRKTEFTSEKTYVMPFKRLEREKLEHIESKWLQNQYVPLKKEKWKQSVDFDKIKKNSSFGCI